MSAASSAKAPPSASAREIGTPAMTTMGPEIICVSPTPSVSWPTPDYDPGVSRPSMSQPLEDQQASSNTRRNPIHHPSAQSQIAPNRVDGRDKPSRDDHFSESERNKIRTRLTALVQPIISPRASPAKSPAWPSDRSSLCLTPSCASSARRSSESTMICASLIDDMIETMHDAPGVGLAAIQVAEPIRLLVVDTAKKEEPPDPQVFINPEIVWSSEERSTYEEGCLSIPEYYAEVERPASVRARALDREGEGTRDPGRGPARHRSAARDRPSQRRSLHRPHLQAQARPGDQEIPESRQARRRRFARPVSPRLASF